MVNLTGKEKLYTSKNSFIDSDLSDELESLSMRLEIDKLYIQAVSKAKHNKVVKNFFDMKEFLYLYGGVYFTTLEGIIIEISISINIDSALPIKIPKGFIKDTILPLLDDEELFDISIRQSSHFMNVFSKMDEKSIFSVSQNSNGTVEIYSNINKSIYNSLLSSNILVDWGIDKKTIVIDFIYSRGDIDSGRLAVFIYALLSEREFSKELVNFIFGS